MLRSLDPILYPLEEDILHAESKFIDNFYELLTKSVKPPYAISVDGLWGTGKTAVMKMLEKKLKEEKYPTFWFNPWEYSQTQEVVPIFIKCLLSAYESNFKDMVKNGIGNIFSLIKYGMDGGLRFYTGGAFNLAFFTNFFKSFKLAQKDTIQGIQEEFTELISRISKDHGDKPVVIFLDDLDRCLPSDTIKLLEALKNLFVTPNSKSIFICGIDTHIAKQFISEHYHGIEEMFAINYFRKIFNLTISMPYKPNVKKLLLNYIAELNWNHLEDQDNSEKLEKAKSLADSIYERGLDAQIESSRKYLNIITNFYTFLKFNQDFKFDAEKDFVINLLILKEAWQPLYENLIKEALRESSDMETLIHKLEERYKDKEKNLSSEQEYFLNEYLGRNSDFKDKILSDELKKYPTLA